MAFELFDRKLVREQELVGRISKQGQMYLNAGASRKLGVGTRFVQIFWDKENRLCGLKAAPAKTSGSYTVKTHWSIASFGSIGFLRHIGYDVGEAWKFRLEWDEGEGMLTFLIPAERLTAGLRQPKPRVRKWGLETVPKVGKGNGKEPPRPETPARAGIEL